MREVPHHADSGHDDRLGGCARGRERAQAPWMPQPLPWNRSLRWGRWTIAGSKSGLFTVCASQTGTPHGRAFAYTTTVSLLTSVRGRVSVVAWLAPVLDAIAVRRAGDHDDPEESGGRDGYNSGTPCDLSRPGGAAKAARPTARRRRHAAATRAPRPGFGKVSRTSGGNAATSASRRRKCGLGTCGQRVRQPCAPTRLIPSGFRIICRSHCCAKRNSLPVDPARPRLRKRLRPPRCG